MRSLISAFVITVLLNAPLTKNENYIEIKIQNLLLGRTISESSSATYSKMNTWLLIKKRQYFLRWINRTLWINWPLVIQFIYLKIIVCNDTKNMHFRNCVLNLKNAICKYRFMNLELCITFSKFTRHIVCKVINVRLTKPVKKLCFQWLGKQATSSGG